MIFTFYIYYFYKYKGQKLHALNQLFYLFFYKNNFLTTCITGFYSNLDYFITRIPHQSLARILYIHQYFKIPEEGGAVRSYRIARAMAGAGHEVTVITGYNGSKKNIVSLMSGLRIVYLPAAYSNHFSPARRVVAFIHFFAKALVEILRCPKFDLCYATSTPLTVGVLALVVKKLKGLPYIFEARDLWPEVPIRLGYISSPVVKKVLYRIEKSIYRNAGGLVALSRPVKEYMEDKVTSVPVILIPNMADEAMYAPVHAKEIMQDGTIKIVYTGTIGRANGLQFLPKMALEIYRAGLPVRWTIAGEGALLESLKAEIETAGLSSVFEFPGHLPAIHISELLHGADFALVSFDAHPVLETCSPNKFFDALAAGTPVLINIGGHLKQTVEQFGCGTYFNRNNPAELIEFLMLWQRDAGMRESLKKGAENTSTEFLATELTGKLLKFVDSLTKQ